MRKVLSAIGVVAAAGIVVIGTTSGGADAAAALLRVVIENDDAHPVPTKAIGATSVTGHVSVTNLPAATPPPLWQGTPYASSKLLINVVFDRCEDFAIPEGQVLFVTQVSAHFDIPPGESGDAFLRLTTASSGQSARVPVPTALGAPIRQFDGNHPGYDGSLALGLPVSQISGCFSSSGGLVGSVAVLGYLVPAS